MKILFEKWWKYDTRLIQIANYKVAFKEYGNKPRLSFSTNGGKKRNGDKCLDVNLWIGYINFNYSNFNLQNVKYAKPKEKKKDAQ